MARASDLGAPASSPVLGRQTRVKGSQPLGPCTQGKSGNAEVQPATAWIIIIRYSINFTFPALGPAWRACPVETCPMLAIVFPPLRPLESWGGENFQGRKTFV